MLTSYEQACVDMISAQYELQGGLQGFCGQIAEEIQSKIGGEITAGCLVLERHHRKMHWWVTLSSGEVVDPMADEFRLKFDDVEHEEVHRDLSLKYW